MDLIAELQRKISDIGPHQRIEGIRSAIRHIEVAERYLIRGRQEQDPESFNDVVYRTNQAFEGVLKEAYSVIEEADATRLSPNEIEQYFLQNKRLTQRVWNLFRNYRQQWRNPATHDHTLLFSEQEALLAIVSVSAFSLVLLDQIVETISFKRHKAEAVRRRGSVAVATDDRSLAVQIVAAIKSFIQETANRGLQIRSEAELVGSLSGFLAGVYPTLQVNPEARIADRYRADLLLRRGNESVVLEVKHGRARRHFVQAAVAHLKEYLSAAHANAGILFFLPSDDSLADRATRLVLEGGKEVWIIGVEP